MMAMIIAAKISRNALAPKKPKSRIVTGMFAQGEARRNAITAGIDAPFLWSCIAIAKIPWLHADMRNPRIVALIIVFLELPERNFPIYSLGMNLSISPPNSNPSRIAHQISLKKSQNASQTGLKRGIK